MVDNMPNKFDQQKSYEMALRIAESLGPTLPPVVISLRIERAAAAIDVSEDYLRKAIEEGRLKAVEKKAKGKGRGIKLIMLDELKRFASTDELQEAS